MAEGSRPGLYRLLLATRLRGLLRGDEPEGTLLHYIDTQEEHHRTLTFQDEYRDFLKKYGIDYDERYVWD